MCLQQESGSRWGGVQCIASSLGVAAVPGVGNALRELAIEFGMPQDDPSNIDCDNNSVVLISRAVASFKSSLYLARRAVFVQESTQEGHTRVRDVHTALNYVDVLTKSFHKTPKVFQRHTLSQPPAAQPIPPHQHGRNA